MFVIQYTLPGTGWYCYQLFFFINRQPSIRLLSVVCYQQNLQFSADHDSYRAGLAPFCHHSPAAVQTSNFKFWNLGPAIICPWPFVRLWQRCRLWPRDRWFTNANPTPYSWPYLSETRLTLFLISSALSNRRTIPRIACTCGEWRTVFFLDAFT